MPNAPFGHVNLQDQLNRFCPAAHEASLGSCVYDLINGYNALIGALTAANIAGFVPPATILLPEQR